MHRYTSLNFPQRNGSAKPYLPIVDILRRRILASFFSKLDTPQMKNHPE